ncbi:DUF3667 domain-containing protein [Flavobacterium aquatile]|uniref:DUF3667 domain-containing protein n=1 Tax=Flavobacterium aquatile LMG 4008 = ATCC 11947 TaxID=1453498 RepID=A0A095SVK0_9FLAO|nr:DUF3667 domain-containing protein [Flavobacterium aquatile]KGD68582.1 hypothetical protein LG45_09935 [Flavobacterium aquatile LMG 4008 = ATCC 11947]OXA68489.1 hypothetical protein B0A61_01910 [Flavobacterium aquatile LMG 4008 = ATCC 11947]GEC79709.1 hypothetical protein FAQ01_25790 [Flavobacterium aquatile]
MSHKSPLRKDKTCLNCNYVVDNRFCPNCGQENTDTRKTFHHLFIHFFEDLTHYENAFWKTIKNLLLKPASLTKEYLSGKRLSYLAPVRLYIFISFVTFFLMAVLPDYEEDNDIVKFDNGAKKETKKSYYDHKETEDYLEKNDSLVNDSILKAKIKEEVQEIENLRKKGVLSDKNADSLIKYITEAKKDAIFKNNDRFFGSQYKSVSEMDSIRKVNPDEINDVEYWFAKKTIPINNKYSSEELKEKFLESIMHNFPKALFIYMPLFAFVLWLFHNKKRWYYFDHGIFTLHYFSFLLLISLLIGISDCLLHFLGDNMVKSTLSFLINAVAYIWMFYYFFPAHHRFYGETRAISFLKSTIILFINIFLIALLSVLLVIYAFINIH